MSKVKNSSLTFDFFTSDFFMSDERKGLTGSLLRGLTRNTVESLAMKMGLKPNERGWLTLDIGASLLSVSPTVAMDFFKAVQEVSDLVDNGDLRAWAEMGRKIALKAPKRRVISSAIRTKFWRPCLR